MPLPVDDDDAGAVVLALTCAVLLAFAYRSASFATPVADDGAPLPSYLKYKEKFLMPVRDQRCCAACWSFSVADMMADTLNAQTAGAFGKRPLSAQYLLSCSSAHRGCEVGGSPEDVYDLPQLTDAGCPLDADLPYEGKETPCRPLPPDVLRVRTVPNTAVSLCDDPDRALPGTRAATIRRNVRNMKRALLQYGPIVGTLRVTGDLYAYRGDGIFRGDPASKFYGYHAVEIVGWCDENVNWAEPGFDGAYWIVRSSWGFDWGVPKGMRYGWAYVTMGENCADIESRASVCRVEFPMALEEVRRRTPTSAARYESYEHYVDDPERENFIGGLKTALGANSKAFRRT
ncbi:putative cysteine protease [Tribonema minus]|uniref:Putative cysteine protease n=1 Tax=Tribonema minus TaxID=303371 RepID=A0A835YX55_9STRA|nr:putative cysteine protease [Tribonema minus]